MNRFVVLLSILVALPASASPIRYEWFATASGQIGDTVFVNENLHFDLLGQTFLAMPFTTATTSGYTSQIIPLPPNSLFSAEVTIGGIGTAGITENLIVIANPNNFCECIGIRKLITPPPGGDVFGLWGTIFNLQNPYDLTTSTELVTGTNVVVFPDLISVATSIGSLRIDSGFGGTFKATLIPIPATVWLLGSALGLLGWLRRH